MSLPGNLPYYMTGPATRPGAMPAYAKRQKKLAAAKAAANPGRGRAKVTPKVKPKVVASAPTSTVTRPNTAVPKPAPHAGKAPNVPHPTGNKGTGKPVVVGGKNNKPKPTPKSSSGPTVGFNPKQMAQTMTNLGYDADIHAIQRQINQNRGDMASALQDLQGWAQQIGQQHTEDTAATAAAWDQAAQQSAANDANIGQLFGGSTAAPSAQYAGVGEDLVSTLGAQDAAWASHLNQILGAQAQDYSRRAQAGFNQDYKDLQGQLRDAQTQKGQAYKQNLMDMMNMAWGRKQDILQYQTAQEALRQSKQMAGLDIQSKKLDIQGQQQEQNYNTKAQKLALKRTNLELKKLQLTANGQIDWSDPGTASNMGISLFRGGMSPRNTFMINPKIALQNAQLALQQMGPAVQGDPRANAAMWSTFQQILNYSHAHKQWMQYRINNKGQLIYDPAKKHKKGK